MTEFLNKENEPILYIIMRNDLNSLGSGKACAQAAHATTDLAEIIHIYHNNDIITKAYDEWVNQARIGGNDCYFGTTIVLSANIEQINDIFNILPKYNTDTESADIKHYAASKIVDPTYPFVMDLEIFNTVVDKTKIVDYVIKGDKVFATRSETTCFYIFGRKGDIQNYVSKLELMP